MQLFVETTKWDKPWVPNHSYILEGTKCIGYIKNGEKEPFFFTVPLNFDKKGRTFQISNYKSPKKNENIVQVKGSKGDIYEVNIETQECSCVGYKFKGYCRHLQNLLK